MLSKSKEEDNEYAITSEFSQKQKIESRELAAALSASVVAFVIDGILLYGIIKVFVCKNPSPD